MLLQKLHDRITCRRLSFCNLISLVVVICMAALSLMLALGVVRHSKSSGICRTLYQSRFLSCERWKPPQNSHDTQIQGQNRISHPDEIPLVHPIVLNSMGHAVSFFPSITCNFNLSYSGTEPKPFPSPTLPSRLYNCA